jgi:hypothetical protein
MSYDTGYQIGQEAGQSFRKNRGNPVFIRRIRARMARELDVGGGRLVIRQIRFDTGIIQPSDA